MYNRLNEGAKAKQHGQLALSKYRQIGAREGEAQALFCLTDALRVGGPDQQREAMEDAHAALGIIRALGQQYNVARAYNYVAMAADAQGNLPEAATLFEQALAAARNAGNMVLEPLMLMDLGATYRQLGARARALSFYEDSQARYEALGDQSRAAEIQANIGEILIKYGGAPDEGLRNVQNALAVFRKLGNRNFEVVAAQHTAEYFRYSGRHGDAERELNRAIAQSRERDLDFQIATSLVIRAKSRFDVADYATARELVIQALPNAQRKDARNARVLLARILLRLGDRSAAGDQLAIAAAELRTVNDAGLLPLLRLVMGELAYRVRPSGGGARHSSSRPRRYGWTTSRIRRALRRACTLGSSTPRPASQRVAARCWLSRSTRPSACATSRWPRGAAFFSRGSMSKNVVSMRRSACSTRSRLMTPHGQSVGSCAHKNATGEAARCLARATPQARETGAGRASHAHQPHGVSSRLVSPRLPESTRHPRDRSNDVRG